MTKAEALLLAEEIVSLPNYKREVFFDYIQHMHSIHIGNYEETEEDLRAIDKALESTKTEGTFSKEAIYAILDSKIK